MATEHPESYGENQHEWRMPGNDTQTSIEQGANQEAVNFSGKIDELVNRLEYINNGHGLREQSTNSSSETNQEVRDRLFAEATLEYYKAMGNSDDVKETFSQLRAVYADKLKGHEGAEQWFYDTAEKEIVKAAFEGLGYAVELVSAPEMRDFAVDFAINQNDRKTYVSVMHQVPVLEFPEGNIVFSDMTDNFAGLFEREDIDTGTVRNIHRQDLDAESKRKAMNQEFARISGAHQDLYAIEKSAHPERVTNPSQGLIITLPNTREADRLGDRKGWQPDPSQELEINAGFVDWREMEPGDYLRNSLRRSLGDAGQAVAA